MPSRSPTFNALFTLMSEMKDPLVIPYLQENGWEMIANEYQALFVHKDRF